MKAFKQLTFDVAHTLPDWPGLHGHTYTAEVWFEGPATDGYVVPESVFSEQLEHVHKQLDHSYLNEFIALPTSENIARWIWDQLWPTTHSLVKVRVFRGSIGFGVEYDLADARAEGRAESTAD
ncbi:MAG: 6-carboxytetrahydropterin synthase [Limnobacter sp.]|nr:6-carboxytetrahydropterin synthase [Limnobacter sp.]